MRKHVWSGSLHNERRWNWHNEMACLANEINSVQSTEPTARSKWISLSAATKKTPKQQNYGVPSIIPPPTSSSCTRDDPHVFTLSTPAKELVITSKYFGTWRCRNEDWSIMYWQLVIRSQDHSLISLSLPAARDVILLNCVVLTKSGEGNFLNPAVRGKHRPDFL